MSFYHLVKVASHFGLSGGVAQLEAMPHRLFSGYVGAYDLDSALNRVEADKQRREAKRR